MKFAFVTPRYGADISSGPEHASRLLAEHLSERHETEVLTTCARDVHTWKNEYSEGADRIRGVLVRRFAVDQRHQRPGPPMSVDSVIGAESAELDWVRRLGPESKALLEYLRRQHRVYDGLVFFSMYHPTTVFGIGIAPDRSIVFPHLQLAPTLRFGIWSAVVGTARAVAYLSAAERTVGRAFLSLADHVEEVVGVGVDMPAYQSYPRHQQDPTDDAPSEEQPDEGEMPEPPVSSDYLGSRGVLFRRRHRLYGPFAVYGGRVAPDNGCEEMLEYFDSYASLDGEMPLVLMGAKMMSIPDHPFVRLGGVLRERERMAAYEAADVALAPEPDDLLATTALESFAVGTPVLASARNEAAVELCRRANAGLYYATRREFVESLRLLTTNPRLRAQLGENGRRYIRQHHRWDAVMGRFERLAMRVRKS